MRLLKKIFGEIYQKVLNCIWFKIRVVNAMGDPQKIAFVFFRRTSRIEVPDRRAIAD